MKKMILCNVRNKRVNGTDYWLKVRKDSIPYSATFVSLATLYFSSK